MNFSENYHPSFLSAFLKLTFENHWPKCLPNLVNVSWLYKIFSNTRRGGEGTKQNYLTRSKQKFFPYFLSILSPWLRFFFLMSFLMVVRSKSIWNRRLLELNINLCIKMHLWTSANMHDILSLNNKRLLERVELLLV